MNDVKIMGWLQLVDEAAALRKRLGRLKRAAIRAPLEARLADVGDELRRRMEVAA